MGFCDTRWNESEHPERLDDVRARILRGDLRPVAIGPGGVLVPA